MSGPATREDFERRRDAAWTNCADLTDKALAGNVVPLMVAAVRAWQATFRHEATCQLATLDCHDCVALCEAEFDAMEAVTAALGED